MKKIISSITAVFLFLLLLNSFSMPGTKQEKESVEKIRLPVPLQNPTLPEIRLKRWEEHLKLKEASVFKNLKWRSVGPLVMSGRITDIAVPLGKHFTIYVAAASGGVWKTTNNGTTWKPVFDKESCITIGDISVSDADPDILWVGGGENNSSRSSYSGTGVFKSTDGGKTWQNMGLNDTHHIGRIIIHPENPDIVYVAAIGHLYTRNEERGVFKTLDGGKTWEKILYINDDTGVIDLVMDPQDPETLYAAAWQRSRKAWNFVESGSGSGIYKTTDGGKNWNVLSSGFPSGKHVGRIGLDIAASKPSVVYAVVDNQTLKPRTKPVKKKPGISSGIDIEDLEKMTKEEFLSLGIDRVDAFLKENNLPAEFKGEMLVNLVRRGEISPPQIAMFLTDANRRLMEANVIGAEVYRSNDKGETWEKVNKKHIERFYNTYGYYFGQIRVDPTDENRVYILGVPLLVSRDGGKTFKPIGGRGVHADHHALWIDPNNPNRLIDGNDGGLNFSYDMGKTWQKINNMPLGQFYTVAVDMEEPYNIYGGLQDNGVYYGPHTSIPGITKPWEMLLRGDGAYVQVDPVETNIVYAEFQFGNVFRIDKKTGIQKSIKPKGKIGELPLRFNWQTPILISPHNRFIIYLGANKLFKSLDRGDNWIPISPDLTTNPQQGDVPYGCIVTIAESPLIPGLIYVGTDDGNVNVTRNGGVTWEKINIGLPQRKWVSRIEASRFDEGTVYVSLNGYRDDDFDKYLYVSHDYGNTWGSIASNLPCGPINVIREDPKNINILYVGTDIGVYISVDRGKSWSTLGSGMPTVAVHDMVIHPRDDDIIVGTHGRSVFVMDAEVIQEFDEKIQAKDIHLFKIKPVSLSKAYRAPFPKVKVNYYLKKAGKVSVSIMNTSGEVLKKKEKKGDAGFNSFLWDLRISGKGRRRETVPPGEYTVVLAAGKNKVNGNLVIKRN